MNTLAYEHPRYLQGPVGQIEALYACPSHPCSVMLLCHPHPLFQGTMTHKILTTAVKTAYAHSVVTLRFNYRGVGNSVGEYGEIDGECQDALAALNWLQATHPKLPVILFGFSFGAFIALSTASQCENVLSTILVAPAVERMPYAQLATIPEPLQRMR